MRTLKMKMTPVIILLTCFILVITSCTKVTTRPSKYPVTMDYIRDNLREGIQSNQTSQNGYSPRVPRSVTNALMPGAPPLMKNYSNNHENRFNVIANNLPAKEFYMQLVSGTHLNMLVHPEVSGTVTVDLKNVTVDETMEAMRDLYGYDFRRTSYGYEVSPPELRSQLFSVNYLDVTRKGKSVIKVNSGQISEQVNSFNVGSTLTGTNSGLSTTNQALTTSKIDTTSEINFWRDLNTSLRAMIPSGQGRSVVVNSQGGVVIVRAFPAELRHVARFLDRIQSNMKRQVILEAKILEVNLNDAFQAGVDWNIFGRGLTRLNNQGGMNQTSFEDFPELDLKDFNKIFAINVKGDFGGLIKLLQEQGNVQILSSPRISTVNNQKAVIKVGQDEFFVTGVSTSTAVVGSTNLLPTQDVSLTPFFSGITLDVTPEIGNDNSVILHIHPTVSEVKDQRKEITLGTTADNTPNRIILPLALSTIRESDNVVRALNGQVVVIGGLMQTVTSEKIAGTPVLSKIPYLGAAFRRTEQISIKKELVILLRPVVVSKKTTREDLEDTDQMFRSFKRGFHVGGLPEDFGTQGECENPFNPECHAHS